MQWFESAGKYLAISVIIVAGTMIYMGANIDDPSRLVFPLIAFSICIPFIMLAMFMWFTGSGQDYLFDKEHPEYDEEECRKYTSYTGFWHFISLTIMLFGVSSLFMNFFIGFGLVVLSLVILATHEIKAMSGKDVDVVPDMNSGFAAFAVILVVLLAVVPATILMTEGVQNQENGISNNGLFDVKIPSFRESVEDDDTDSIEDIDMTSPMKYIREVIPQPPIGTIL